jgi:peptidoglycan/LPS O-acetylase OafA/YrhL
MQLFNAVDGRLSAIMDRIRMRYATAVVFIYLAVTSYLQPSTTSVLAWWDTITYGREINSAWFVIGALIILYRDNLFTYFLGTLPFVWYLILAMVTIPSTGSWYVPGVLVLAALAMFKVYHYEINGGHK